MATSALTLARGGSATQVVTVSSADGFIAPVRLTIMGLPSGTGDSVTSSPVTPSANGQASAMLTLRAPTTTFIGTLTVKVKGTSTSRCARRISG